MAHTHVARSKAGTLHLTLESGWTHGVTGVEVWPIEETPERLREGDKWCRSCLGEELRDGLRVAEIDYERAKRGEGLYRVWPGKSPPAGNDGIPPSLVSEAADARRLTNALRIAIDALLEIAEAGGEAGHMAFEAAGEIKVTLNLPGGDA